MSNVKILPALIAERRGRKSIHQAAREAGVAFRTLKKVIEGSFELVNNEPVQPQNLSPRTIRGYVVSLYRLSSYVGTSVDEVLRDYGFDPDMPAVKNALATLSPKPQGAPPVTNYAVVTESARLRVGLLTWSPLVPSLPVSAWQEPSAGLDSFGRRYLTSLLTALNPEVGIKSSPVHKVGIGIDSLSESAQLDLLVGVCETVYRRQRGIHFINLPGLGIPISGLACGVTEFTWEEFVNLQDRSPSDANTSFVTVRDEVGDLFIRGHESLTTYKLIRLDDIDAKELSIALLKRAYYAKGTAILVADAFTVNKTLKEIRALLVDDECLSGLANKADIPVKEIRDLAKRVCRIQSTEWPLYPLSIAVREGLGKSASVLKQCQRDELFGNRVTLAAKLYLQLLEEEDCLEPLPLTDQLSESQSRRFCRVLEDMLNRRISSQQRHLHTASRDRRAGRIRQFLNAWQPAEQIPERSPIAPSDFLAVLEDIERKILTAEAPFAPGTSVSVLQLAPLLAGIEVNLATVSQLDWDKAVEAFGNVCKFWILPALHSVGLIEETETAAVRRSSLATSFSTWSFSGHYVVPQRDGSSGAQDRWMYWERYHCETTFACLVASSPNKNLCLSELRRILDEAKKIGDLADSNAYWQFSQLDRQFHLSICQFGSPEGRPAVSVRNLERAYNRLNAALATADVSMRKERARHVVDEHEEIYRAIESTGNMPVLEDYRMILAAYSQHFFNVDHSHARARRSEAAAAAYHNLGIDREFLSKLESSVLREVSALELIDSERFFVSAKCQILRTNGLIPDEWEPNCAKAVIQSIAEAIQDGCVFHYVSWSPGPISEPFRERFESFQAQIVRLLHDPGLSQLVQDHLFWIHAEKGTHSFLAALQDDHAEGLIVYGGPGIRSSQLTARRRSHTGDVGSIRRQIEKTELDKQQFVKDYGGFLSEVVNGGGSFSSVATKAQRLLPEV